MARSRGFSKTQPLTLDKQIYRMRLVCPWFKLTDRRRQAEATWVGKVQPSALSSSYIVMIRARMGWNPEVRVLSPELLVREGAKSLPHVYGDGSLCLHTPGEWQPSQFIADVVVPWISSWLYFYEVWLATGSWLGGGTHSEKPEHSNEFTQSEPI
jgi:hypothetical protein